MSPCSSSGKATKKTITRPKVALVELRARTRLIPPWMLPPGRAAARRDAAPARRQPDRPLGQVVVLVALDQLAGRIGPVDEREAPAQPGDADPVLVVAG